MKKISGLTSKEAEKILIKYGKNEIVRTEKISPIKLFLSQFTSPLILILVAAAVISWGIGYIPGQESNIADTILILLIVLASGTLGFLQDYKAEKTIEALQRMSTPKARVIRDGNEVEIYATDLVPGDIILLESGDVIPADAKLFDSYNLKVDESVLTGESAEVDKKNSDDVFMNTFVYVGTAKAQVTKTGMNAKVGEIASKLQEIKDEKTSFQVEMSRFSKKISGAVLAIAVIIFLVSLTKYALYQSVLTAISLAVAAIPEGLPAVIVLALAIGAKSMVRSNALIRKLAVTESIGAVDIICTDKTGTLTKNEMTVTNLYLNNTVFDTQKISKSWLKEITPLLLCGALCNNSGKGMDSNGNKKYLGDQTEIALRKISEAFGMIKERLDKEYERRGEVPFTSKRKMMSVVCSHKGKNYVYSKGAPEVIMEKCDKIYHQGKIIRLNTVMKKRILEQNCKFASDALRVLGFAFKDIKGKRADDESGLIWLGLQAMRDPPREEVKEALENCRTAGIRVIMLTGDNPLTAKAIANEVWLESTEVITGVELDKISDKVLEEKLKTGANIFARISPFHKLRVLEILKKENRVVMTGDGVNDALALKKADVGIAMGIRGTEVSKEASDMILLDDNFASITTAIKEGRRIFNNIRKFVNYLFICNFAEVIVLFLATLFLTLKEPILLPIQILWINLLTDGLPALALGVDPAPSDVMMKPPRKRDEPIINRRLAWSIIVIGLQMTVILFITFFLVLPGGIEVARTALFTGFVVYEILKIGAIRYQEKLSWLSNKWLIAALAASFFLQLLIIYSPLNLFFHIVPLGLYEWSVLLGGTIIGYIFSIASIKAINAFIRN